MRLVSNFTVPRSFGSLLLALGLAATFTACGAKESEKDSAPATAAPVPGEEKDVDGNKVDRSFEKKVALGPDGLALKIRSAFGIGLTTTVAGGREVDFVAANGTLFTGAISPDPNIKIPKQLASVSYFLALNGLAEVVAKNYTIKMATNTAARSCTNLDDARMMVQVVYPPVATTDRDLIAQSIVDSCNIGVTETVRAIITSYAFALDTSI